MNSQTEAPQNVSEWFEKGRDCFRKSDGMGTVSAMERVTELDAVYCHPDGDTPYFYMGKIHEVEGNIGDAIFCYTRALAINQADEESLIGRGSCYTVKGEHSQAIADFMKVLTFPDEHRRAPVMHLYSAIAENYRQLKDWFQAHDWGQKALLEDPTNTRHQDLVKEAFDHLKKTAH